jgi:hypothetical protein
MTLAERGFCVVVFRGEGMTVDELIFHHPNGTFAAQRMEE